MFQRPKSTGARSERRRLGSQAGQLSVGTEPASPGHRWQRVSFPTTQSLFSVSILWAPICASWPPQRFHGRPALPYASLAVRHLQILPHPQACRRYSLSLRQTLLIRTPRHLHTPALLLSTIRSIRRKTPILTPCNLTGTFSVQSRDLSTPGSSWDFLSAVKPGR